MPSLPVHIEWVAPAGCPSRDEMLGVVERIVGANALRSAVDARVIVTRDERGFHAEVTVSSSGATSTRSLVGESCRAVGDAAALVVALAASPEENPPAPRLPAAPAPILAPPPERDASPAPPRVRRVVFVDASFFVNDGSLPSLGLGGELGVGWNPAHWDLEIVGAFLAPQRATLASMSSQGADLWLAHLGARACYELFDARLDVGPCVGGGVQWVTAQGFGSLPDVPAKATGNLVVGSLGGRAIGRLSSRVVLRLVVEASVPSTRPTFVIIGGDQVGQVFRTSAASFVATAGAETHF
jgi:hypothetical protein